LPPQEATPPLAAAAIPPANVPQQPANAPETFQKATLNMQVDDKKKEIAVVVTFNEDALVVTEKKDRGVSKTFPYTSIKGAEYSYARLPQWKTKVPDSLALPSRDLKHWFLVHSNEDYALVVLDKANYDSVLAAFELRTGKKIELVGDGN
jgi:hypothetical protein